MWFLVGLLFLASQINSEEVQVLIIGAGPAGIAAASKLLKNNVTNIKILEAEPRIGGRINSVKFGDKFIDLGAEWVHGQKGNIVYEMVKDYNIVATSPDIGEIHYGRGVVEEDLAGDFLIVADKLATGDIDSALQNNSSSMEELAMSYYNQTILQKYKKDPVKSKQAQEAIYLLEHYLLGYESAFYLDKMPSSSHYEESEGENLVWEGHGYKTILDVLTLKYPDPSKALPIDDKILLNKQVSKISWNQTSSVQVQCVDGTEFQAKQVIFTPSLGVLKHDHQSLFNPGLPQEKIEAIENMGFGAVIKVALLFDEPWNKSSIFLWSFEDRKMLQNKFPPVKNGNSWLSNSHFTLPAEQNPKVLIMWFTGPLVPETELLSDDQIIEGCLFALNHFLGGQRNFTKPLSMIRTKWLSNPHFRGTWSYETLQSAKAKTNFNDVLSQPLRNMAGQDKVLFAGEATNRKHYSTVHGAIETGFREAKRILDEIQ